MIVSSRQVLTTLNLSDRMPIEEFLNNPEEEKIYEVLDDNKLIEGLVEVYKKRPEVPIDNNEDDYSIKPVIISADEASKSLEIVYAFLLQQGNTKEQLKQVNALDRYINF